MIKIYPTLRVAALATACGLGSLLSAQAQLAQRAASAQNVAGTYADLGITGTAIATTTNDDANSAAQNIGFSFAYNGATFTQFVLNTNGLLKLGATAPSATNLFLTTNDNTYPGGPFVSTNAADINLLAPFNCDLQPGTSTPEFRVAVTGTSPNRVCTIQWKNMRDKLTPPDVQFDNISFQVKLYETTNVVEFVYDTWTPASAATSAFKSAIVGLKGANSGSNNFVTAWKLSSDAFAAAAFQDDNYDSNSGVHFNYRKDAAPTAGRTLRFGIPVPCVPVAVTAFPYTETFDASANTPCGITITDVNADGKTWAVAAANPSSSPNAIRYTYSPNSPANDWFFTPALVLQTGLRYQLGFKYRAGLAAYPEGLEVKYGAAATPAGQTNTLFSNTAITNVTYITTTTGTASGQVASFTPTTAGTYYVGFHAISDLDEYFLYIDDISITAATITATKSNVTPGFSAEASPVPFSSQLTLKLNTLQAGLLQLTLHDALGRVVRQTSTKAAVGASTVAVPEAGSLPAGVYILTVRQGGNTQVIRVTHE